MITAQCARKSRFPKIFELLGRARRCNDYAPLTVIITAMLALTLLLALGPAASASPSPSQQI
jgi:hypothetical protein